MKTIIVTAPKGGGKDAVYAILKEAKLVHGKHSFAGPLKKLCEEHFGIHYNLLNDPVLKEKEMKTPITLTNVSLQRLKHKLYTYLNPDKPGQFYNVNKVPTQGLVGRIFKTPRELLQIIGTEFIRNRVHKNWHVMASLSEDYLKMLKVKKGGLYVNTDCRFENEYDILHDQGTVTEIYVERPEAEERLAEATHSSELDIKLVKEKIIANGGIIIKNDGTLEDLKEKVLGVVTPLVKELSNGSPKRSGRKAKA